MLICIKIGFPLKWKFYITHLSLNASTHKQESNIK